MANLTVIQSTTTRAQLRATASAVLTENYDPIIAASQTAPTSQTVYGVLLGLKAGDSVAGVRLRTGTAAGGTAPTLARFGIADSTGKILAISNDLGAAAGWTLGPCNFAFSSAYTVLADGGYYACFVVNGTWGSTQPTVIRIGSPQASSQGAASGGVAPNFKWTGQTDLPAVNSSLTLSTQIDLGYYMGFY